MPPTPFHLGPAFFIWSLFRKKIDLPAILLGSVIVDLEVLYNFLNNGNFTHGFSHTYFGAALYGIAVASFFIAFGGRMKNLYKKGVQEKSILLGGVLGTFSHLLLDSFLWSDMKPFWPIEGNPFLGLGMTVFQSMLLSVLLALAGFVIYYARKAK